MKKTTSTTAQDGGTTRVAVLGTGKMGGILLQGFLERKLVPAANLAATARHDDRARSLGRQFPIAVGTDNLAAVHRADVVLICVKPQAMREVLEEIRPALAAGKLLISIAASVPIASIEKLAGAGVPVVRAMPNMPCQVGCGMTALARGKHASDAHLAMARRLFEAVGKTIVLDEKHMDAVTGLSASGPAFVYVILESLAEAGVKVGLPREVATLLAAQTALGAAQVVLETGAHPALLKDAVTTPAGCTIDGLLELEDGRLRVTLIKAVVKAVQRARELWFEP
ncbi:MAG TPA: pyrroline-5-carboxylate reductase [Candidatus Acidoferrales bacterium]|nr:pyrroline-5-carboxylate reductase [Candidatus Acidoferrales bacterium]